MSKETVITKGFTVACMVCHNGKPMAVDTQKQAYELARVHLSIKGGHKDHSGHTVVITPVQLVRRKK